MRHTLRELRSLESRDQMQSHVDSGRNARRGDHRPLVDPAHRGIDEGIGGKPRKLLQILPVSSDPALTQEPGNR